MLMLSCIQFIEQEKRCKDMVKTWDVYGKDILNFLGLDIWTKKNYKSLLEHLHNREFTWIMDRDDNRADDGVKLRRTLEYDFGERPCSVLEMLAGLALRAEVDIIGDPGDPRPGDFFWEMIENLALDSMTEKEFDKVKVDRIVDRWLNREFLPDGRGSVFYVRNDIRDMRKLEIWDQMNSYIYERYD